MRKYVLYIFFTIGAIANSFAVPYDNKLTHMQKCDQGVEEYDSFGSYINERLIKLPAKASGLGIHRNQDEARNTAVKNMVASLGVNVNVYTVVHTEEVNGKTYVSLSRKDSVSMIYKDLRIDTLIGSYDSVRDLWTYAVNIHPREYISNRLNKADSLFRDATRRYGRAIQWENVTLHGQFIRYTSTNIGNFRLGNYYMAYTLLDDDLLRQLIGEDVIEARKKIIYYLAMDLQKDYYIHETHATYFNDVDIFHTQNPKPIVWSDEYIYFNMAGHDHFINNTGWVVFEYAGPDGIWKKEYEQTRGIKDESQGPNSNDLESRIHYPHHGKIGPREIKVRILFYYYVGEVLEKEELFYSRAWKTVPYIDNKSVITLKVPDSWIYIKYVTPTLLEKTDPNNNIAS